MAHYLAHEQRMRRRRSFRLVRWILISCGTVTDGFLRRIKTRTTQIMIDGCAAATGVLVAYLLRFDFAVPHEYARAMWFWTAAMAVLRPASIRAFTGYRSVWRFLRVQDMVALIGTSLPPSLLMLALRLGMRHTWFVASVPLGVVALEFAMSGSLAMAARGLRRAIYETSRSAHGRAKRALMLGTEETFSGALEQVRTFPELEVAGLVMPGRRLLGCRIGRVPVIGEPHQLGSLLSDHQVDVILIADASLDNIAETVSLASQFGTDVRLLPSARNVMRGEVRVAAPVNPELAFGPERIQPLPLPIVIDAYRGRTVLVSGAGGSIGSELCRQACTLGVSRLLLLDHDENSIFEIERELKIGSPDCDLIPIVGNVRDLRLMHHVFNEHSPEIVIHSAAYKHVPVMEANISEAFLNNVIGTRQILETALEFGSKRFVMVSSDKAVSPASVMGATKRLGEMIVQSSLGNTATHLACVRFGNVVGSRGSVVPIFLRQIAEGKAITLTDERMSRYFMTITEAVQLVLQASTLDSSGEIYMLDMGDPMMIAALARKLIEMSGLRPDKDVPIEVVGIRPGEKLHESLWTEHAEVFPTSFPRIHAVHPSQVLPDLERELAELEELALERRDKELLRKLHELPIGYEQAMHSPR